MRNCRPSGRRVRDATLTRAGVTDETLPRKSVAGAEHLPHDVTRTQFGVYGYNAPSHIHQLESRI